MKPSLLLLVTFGLFSCVQSTDNTKSLQQRVERLEARLADTYKPGLGELMSSIQLHHNKLWFAGQNQNWKLADFEVHEITETVEDIQKYLPERKESKEVGVLSPALDSMNAAIQQKSTTRFKSSYILLTNTCNNCHRATRFEFNVVKIPDTPPFSNQDFKATP